MCHVTHYATLLFPTKKITFYILNRFFFTKKNSFITFTNLILVYWLLSKSKIWPSLGFLIFAAIEKLFERLFTVFILHLIFFVHINNVKELKAVVYINL